MSIACLGVCGVPRCKNGSLAISIPEYPRLDVRNRVPGARDRASAGGQSRKMGTPGEPRMRERTSAATNDLGIVTRESTETQSRVALTFRPVID